MNDAAEIRRPSAPVGGQLGRSRLSRRLALALFLGAVIGGFESMAARVDALTRPDQSPLAIAAPNDLLAAAAGWSPLFVSRAAGLRDLDARLALQESPQNLDRAETRSHAALRRSPTRADAWARLAYIDATRNGALTAEGLSALNRSFVAVPFGGPSFQTWRVEFALIYWSALNDEARRHLSRAIDVLAMDSTMSEALRQISSQLPDPEASQFLSSRL